MERRLVTRPHLELVFRIAYRKNRKSRLSAALSVWLRHPGLEDNQEGCRSHFSTTTHDQHHLLVLGIAVDDFKKYCTKYAIRQCFGGCRLTGHRGLPQAATAGADGCTGAPGHEAVQGKSSAADLRGRPALSQLPPPAGRKKQDLSNQPTKAQYGSRTSSPYPPG